LSERIEGDTTRNRDSDVSQIVPGISNYVSRSRAMRAQCQISSKSCKIYWMNDPLGPEYNTSNQYSI
jgi:hypothetical protein